MGEKQLRDLIPLMPELNKLRREGFSFRQIADVLGQAGFRLRPSEVRQYYEERLAERMDENMQLFNEQLLLLAEIEKVTAGYQKPEQVSPEPPSNAVCIVAPVAPEYPPEGLNNDLRCLPLQPDVKTLPRRDGVPQSVYQVDGLMEHPAIPGLMLSLNERLYWAKLEVDDNGQTRIETDHERAFRVKWKKPIPPTLSATGADFVKMDYELFKYVGKPKPPGWVYPE